MSAHPSRAEVATPVAAPAAVTTVAVTRWRAGVREALLDQLAEETPVAVLCNGEPHAVMLMSPADLEDFALGFALTEGLIAEPRELVLVEQRALDDGITLDLIIPARLGSAAPAQPRAIAGRSGCGLCGKRMIEDAMRMPAAIAAAPRISRAAITRASLALSAQQPINRVTGAVHAAAWVDLAGEVIAVREDIGRHNALDKLIGARIKGNFPPGFALVTCRASYEIVMKAAMADIGVLAAVSAPTARAVRLAQTCQLTLAAFVRGPDLVIYTHAERIVDGGNE
jgi:FdhD protein